MDSSIIKHLRYLLLIATAAIAAAQAVAPPAGRFYIVGMGTAPDLITVRAQRVVARADILMAEEGELRTIWAGLARGKEIWEWPHSLRQFYGADPKMLQNPGQRGLAEAMQGTRRQLIERITSAVAAGKVVACIESGDPLMYGMTLFLEMLPRSVPTEVVPGIGAFQGGPEGGAQHRFTLPGRGQIQEPACEQTHTVRGQVPGRRTGTQGFHAAHH